MATERQIAANRANAKKSTGPKSPNGKRRSSRNAFVHGLTGQIPTDPQSQASVEQHARDIVASTRGRIDMANARAVAHAQLQVVRARSISSAIVGEAYPVSSTEHHGDIQTSWSATKIPVPLRLLDRYQRRALARRTAAIIQSLRG